ncbi:MAG: hypothetical protein A2051_08925 [Desulfovibrionales bacterium GWA2_65_9]|nr:MAG: hypothetical protein A2051_08925 [Desulfovibrionales bacterium GWA2_65_9]
MQIVWRTLPKLALPAAIGLGLAYLATSFVPRPAPSLRPPEELRAQGQAYGEESPVGVILERNVLNLESSPFFPLGQPPAPIVVPESAAPAPAAQPTENAPAPTQAAFAQADTSVTPKGPAAQAAGGRPISATAPISGGHSVQGQAVRPAAVFPPAAPGASGSVEPLAQTASGAALPAAQSQTAPIQTASPAAKALASQASPPKPRAADKADAPAVQAAPRLGLQGFRLVGVIAGGERPLAMLQVDGASVSLRLGEEARGWTLVSVDPGQVLLQSGAERRRLLLGGAGPAQRAKAP